jgi:hypothetical protein
MQVSIRKKRFSNGRKLYHHCISPKFRTNILSTVFQPWTN